MQSTAFTEGDGLAARLEAVYGAQGASAQAMRYAEMAQRLRSVAGPGNISFFRAPGRVNLIGEHTDYNHGFVMPVALDRDIALAARPRQDRTVRIWNMEPERFTDGSFELSAAIPPHPRGDWRNYLRGAAQTMFQVSNGSLLGMDAVICGRKPFGVPIAAGLSSSSALTVAAAVALVALNGLHIQPAELAHLCSEAEWYVGTRGGMMDQFVSLLAQRDHALFLDCQPQTDAAGGKSAYTTRQVAMPLGYSFMICNSGVEREKTRSLYNVRVAECRLGVAILKRSLPQIGSLRDVSAQALGMTDAQVIDMIDAVLPDHATPAGLERQGIIDANVAAMLVDFAVQGAAEFRIRPRCRHVVTENARVLASITALESGDAIRFGRLLNEAHLSMSRDYEASCPEVDTLAEVARSAPGVLGARVTGAGWGGCVLALVEQGAEEAAGDAIKREYKGATGIESVVFTCRSAPGAGQIT